MKKLVVLLSLVLLMADVGTTSATTYFFDFDAGISSQWSGITHPESVQGYAGLGTGSNVFSGNFLRNDTGGYGDKPKSPDVPQTPTILTLTGLPAHTSVSLGFLLAVIDSWDGNSNAKIDKYPVGPDYFTVRVLDGTKIWTFSETFSNFAGVSQSYSGPKLGGGLSPRGFNSTWDDSAYNLGLDPVFHNIPHTNSTLIVEWFASGAGWQGDNLRFGGTQDESWAIDNVRVDLNHAPLPPTCALLGSGLLGLGLLGFWRKRKA
jgi:hypothetical protein